VKVLGIDGHDGSGKTTLAENLAGRLGGSYRRPFSGQMGREFLAAGESGEFSRAIELGAAAIDRAISEPDLRAPVVLDRSWITVASVTPWDLFSRQWTHWLPTMVCWCDLETTLRRLAQRSEKSADVAWHEHYISRYQELANIGRCPLIRTDELDETQSLELALAYARELLTA
jgi:thymidylate kinase